MSIERFTEEYEEFVEEKEFLATDDGDPDEYRRGYRKGYYDALVYTLDWLRELDGI